MLNRSSRLTTKLFNEVMKNGKVVHTAFFLARVQPADSLRIAAVAPVKIAKTAVLRNRTRRRIYAAVRSLAVPPSSAAHIILIAKAPFLQSEDIGAITEDIKGFFVKAGLLR